MLMRSNKNHYFSLSDFSENGEKKEAKRESSENKLAVLNGKVLSVVNNFLTVKDKGRLMQAGFFAKEDLNARAFTSAQALQFVHAKYYREQACVQKTDLLRFLNCESSRMVHERNSIRIGFLQSSHFLSVATKVDYKEEVLLKESPYKLSELKAAIQVVTIDNVRIGDVPVSRLKDCCNEASCPGLIAAALSAAAAVGCVLGSWAGLYGCAKVTSPCVADACCSLTSSGLLATRISAGGGAALGCVMVSNDNYQFFKSVGVKESKESALLLVDQILRFQKNEKEVNLLGLAVASLPDEKPQEELQEEKEDKGSEIVPAIKSRSC